ncbi:MAG: PAS domain-containing protein, partial [Ktedonobacterales bacterium]|nr:PAS domain-containing protein [Ktedonobacterales bacterium]
MPLIIGLLIMALATAGWYGWREHAHATALLDEASGAAGQPLATTNEVERVLRALIEAIPSPVFLTTADRVILHANRAAQYMVELPRDRLLGQVLAKAIQDYETTQMLIAAATSGTPQERTISRSAERETWHVTVQPLSLPGPNTPDDTKKVSHLLLFIDDETKLRYLENVRKDFVASVSHELRTPLASVKLLAETLGDAVTDDPAEAQAMSGRITVEVDHLTG